MRIPLMAVTRQSIKSGFNNPAAKNVYAALVLTMSMSITQADAADPTSPSYRPEQQVSGVIRTWGHGSRHKDYIGGLVKSWQANFHEHQPQIEFDTSLLGDDSAIGGLYTRAADIAILERGLLPIESDGYQPVMGHDPVQVAVATGSFDLPNHAPAVAIIVNRDNPLSRLTVEQLDAVFGADHRRGRKNIRTWGELGLTGKWADKSIHVYVPGLDQDASQFFEKAVMGGSQKWTGDLREFTDQKKPDGSVVDAGREIADEVANDRYGLGLSTFIYKIPKTKPLALAANNGGPYYEPNRETIAARTYPLSRTVFIFFDQAPGQPIEPRVREYLSFILSNEGQEAIARDGGYFPLPKDVADQERSKLQ